MRKKITTLILGLAVAAPMGCGEPEDVPWTGSVDAETDQLTGDRTGIFRTYGPTASLAAGPDTVLVTVGYTCEINNSTEPPGVADGLFFRLALPDTSLFYEVDTDVLSGRFGLLGAARISVDGEVEPWRYDTATEPGVWTITASRSPHDIGTPDQRDEALMDFRGLYREVLASSAWVRDAMENSWGEMEQSYQDFWPPVHDYVGNRYRQRDTLRIELASVLEFSMKGFDAAVDSVRFWCPVSDLQREWNAGRHSFLAAIDSTKAKEEARRAAETAAAAARAEARAAAAAEKEREIQRLVDEMGFHSFRFVAQRFVEVAQERQMPFPLDNDQLALLCKDERLAVWKALKPCIRPPTGDYR